MAYKLLCGNCTMHVCYTKNLLSLSVEKRSQFPMPFIKIITTQMLLSFVLIARFAQTKISLSWKWEYNSLADGLQTVVCSFVSVLLPGIVIGNCNTNCSPWYTATMYKPQKKHHFRMTQWPEFHSHGTSRENIVYLPMRRAALNKVSVWMHCLLYSRVKKKGFYSFIPFTFHSISISTSCLHFI